jgi:hypothetical protein
MLRRPIDALEWSPVALLPNIKAESPIGSQYALLVSANDERVRDLGQAFPAVRDFADRFSDILGNKETPSYILFHKDFVRRHSDSEALVGFRDAIALSSILRARALAINGGWMGHNAAYADSFDFYPLFLDNNLSGIVGSSGGLMTSLDSIGAFRAHTSPQVPHRIVDQLYFDRYLGGRLMDEWSKCFVRKQDVRQGRRLFRSLQMAFHAFRVPYSYAGIDHDLGRLVALLVSAHEILIHDGKRASKEHVRDALERYAASSKVALVKSYKFVETRKTSTRVTALSKAYWHLNDARNDFLHGNMINAQSLNPNGLHGNIYWFGAIVYRLLLEVRLGTLTSLGGWDNLSDDMSKNEVRATYESALLRLFGKSPS